MEHVEPAGIHSGDSACCLPSISLSSSTLNTVRKWTKLIAKRLNVVGLINLQFTAANIIIMKLKYIFLRQIQELQELFHSFRRL